MRVYYNDNDSYCAAWLYELMKKGMIPYGDIDTRSITAVQHSDVAAYDQCHFFAGIGGWPYALKIAGWNGPVWTGSCPCQPFSGAGKGETFLDERDLWPDFYRLIKKCRPTTVFGEQVASPDGRLWLSGVRSDLEELDYAVGAADLCAAGVEAPQIRQRLFWVGESNRERRQSGGSAGAPLGHGGSALSASDARGLADAGHSEWRAQRFNRDNGCDRQNSGRQETHGEPGTCGEVRGLGDTDKPRSQGWGEHVGEYAHQRVAGQASDIRGLAVSESEQHDGCGDAWRGRGQSANGSDPWASAEWLPCLDGKARRIEPGTFPLAASIPVDMGRGRSRLERMAIGAARAYRTGTLRGYGNAIVPQVAAEFIATFMEFQDCQ